MIVEEGLRAGVNPNCCDKDGISGLAKAVTNKQDEVGTPSNNQIQYIYITSKVVELMLGHPETDVNLTCGPGLTVVSRSALITDGAGAPRPCTWPV